MIDYPPIFRLIVFCLGLVMAWRYQTTGKVLVKVFTPFMIVAFAIMIVFGIGVTLSAWYIGGLAIATEAIKSWTTWMAVLMGALTALFVWLWGIVFLSGFIDWGIRLARGPKAKRKGIPQSLGDTARLALNDDAPSIDLRFEHQTDSDRHSLSIGGNQPSVF